MIIPLRSVSDSDLLYCGGKGASLVRMTHMGLPVPEAWIVMPGTGTDEVADFASRASDKYTYAVRSSALNEDGEDASFAGAYETVTDVKKDGIAQAYEKVTGSVSSERVASYSEAVHKEETEIAVVIQRFVKPEYAGVIFTSDIITGSSAVMVGNLVRGEGELLVSGNADAEEFRFDDFSGIFDGPDCMRPYAKKLYKYCRKIRKEYGCPMDIEWAVSEGKLYILQARPVTTIKRGNKETYEINCSYAGDYLLTRTNVGEIFMRPVSPVTFSILEVISSKILPGFIDFIDGQAYMNLSVLTSALVSFGMTPEKAYSKLEDLGGKLPEGVTVPVFPMKSSQIMKNVFELIRPKPGASGKKYKLADHEAISELIKKADTPGDLRKIFDSDILPFINGGLKQIAKGVNLAPLFGTSSRIEEICGEELAGRIMAGTLGTIDSMKPLMLLEDCAEGKMSREEYVRLCGHRHVNEMELSCPYPFEDPAFPDDLIEKHIKSGVNMHELQAKQEQEYLKALDEFDRMYPSKKTKIRKLIRNFIKSNEDRERVRSEGVWIFVVLREYLLRAGALTGTGDDVFMLYMDEVLELLEGNIDILSRIGLRRANYNRYLEYPQFPNLILGHFDPDRWISDTKARKDYFGPSRTSSVASDVKGFPGASGKVTGRARVITDISQGDLLEEGEILVTTATNIGWTVLFSRTAAIVTDIGAPLSHAAIVAREFGIPAVVGCGNATTVIRTGDMITVDGTSGTVAVIHQ